MRNFSMTLPPFSPDYSGVCSALFNLNGLIVIHDASGCTGNYTGFDEPRWYGSAKPIYCSGLRKMDAVFGNEERLLEKIERAARERPVDFIAIVGSPVPMVIGTDMEGVAREIERRCGVPAFGFSTNGTRYYNEGVAMAACAVIDRFAKGVSSACPSMMNILGATPLDISRENLGELKALLAENGWRVNACCATDWTMQEIRNIGAAAVNLAISQAGREIAIHLEERFGTPWIADLPVGKKGAGACLARLAARAAGERVSPDEARREGAEALVLGDAVCASAIC